MNLGESIARAVVLIRSSTNLGDAEVCRQLVDKGISQPAAARLVEFLPMIYCRVLLAKSGLRFPDTYRRLLPDGTCSEPVPFSSHPIWNDATAFAEVEVRQGLSSEDLLAIAGRSAEFDAASKLLNGGSKLENIMLTEPVLRWAESDPDF